VWIGLEIPGHSTDIRRILANRRNTPGGSSVGVAFAAKLRMAAAALGCNSRKESALPSVNPATQ
jgi:hypothetical protein